MPPIVGARLPATWRAATANSVNAVHLTVRGVWFYCRCRCRCRARSRASALLRPAGRIKSASWRPRQIPNPLVPKAVGARLPATWRAAAANSVNAVRLTGRGVWFYCRCCARSRASAPTPCGQNQERIAAAPPDPQSACAEGCRSALARDLARSASKFGERGVPDRTRCLVLLPLPHQVAGKRAPTPCGQNQELTRAQPTRSISSSSRISQSAKALARSLSPRGGMMMK